MGLGIFHSGGDDDDNDDEDDEDEEDDSFRISTIFAWFWESCTII